MIWISAFCLEPTVECVMMKVTGRRIDLRRTSTRPPVGTDVSLSWSVEAWTAESSTESVETPLRSWTCQKLRESTNLKGVPEGHTILDCNAPLDCIGEELLRSLPREVKFVRRQFGTFQISLHPYRANFNPDHLYLTSRILVGSVDSTPLSVAYLGSAHWSKQCRGMIVQLAVTTSIDPSQQRDRIYHKRAGANSRRATKLPLTHDGFDHPSDLSVSVTTPSEKITEQWRDDLHDLYTCNDTNHFSNKSITSTNDLLGCDQRRRHHLCTVSFGTDHGTVLRDTHSDSHDRGAKGSGSRQWQKKPPPDVFSKWIIQ